LSDHAHPELAFWQKYIFSQDHKIIGIQYGITSLISLFLGFTMIILMRWQLAHPGDAIPLIGGIFGPSNVSDGAMLPDFYNQLGAMHGTIMIFLGVVPLAVGAFGNYLVPLQIGAADMAFPKLNMASYWAYFVGVVLMLGSFFVPGGAAQSGWTSYPPPCSHCRNRANFLVIWNDLSHHLLTFGIHEYFGDHHSNESSRNDLLANAISCMGSVCNQFSFASGFSTP